MMCSWLSTMSCGVRPSAVTLAAYVLGRTERVAAGTAVSVLSVQHPVALAEQAALLDQVSGGRFWLGVGRGGPSVDLEVFGTGLDRYESGFAEGLDLLMGALIRERVSAAGPAFAFREVAVVPRPRTCPHPPVVVAAASAATARLAAALGLPMLLGMHMGDEAQRVLRGELPRRLGPGLAGYVPVDGRPAQPGIRRPMPRCSAGSARLAPLRTVLRSWPRPWSGPGSGTSS